MAGCSFQFPRRIYRRRVGRLTKGNAGGFIWRNGGPLVIIHNAAAVITGAHMSPAVGMILPQTGVTDTLLTVPEPGITAATALGIVPTKIQCSCRHSDGSCLVVGTEPFLTREMTVVERDRGMWGAMAVCLCLLKGTVAAASTAAQWCGS